MSGGATVLTTLATQTRKAKISFSIDYSSIINYQNLRDSLLGFFVCM
jgi:hypothetical protein